MFLPVVVVVAPLPDAVAQSRPWTSDRPCGDRLTQAAVRAAPEVGQGCKCATTPERTQVCQCLTDSLKTVFIDEWGVARITLLTERDPSTIFDSLEVLTGDIDGEDGDEIVIPTFESSSNGLGIGYWSVYVLERRITGWRGDPVSVEDYNPGGSWVRVTGEKGCDLLETHWVSGYEARRPGGLYFEARWLRFSGARLEPRVDRPVLRRRLLNSFAEERGRTVETTGPLSWLLHPTARP
jgi:hypothetical protein